MARTIKHWIGGALGLAALLPVGLFAVSTAAVACAVMLVASGNNDAASLKNKLVSSNSKVVLAWDLSQGVVEAALTIAANYHGAPQEFAAVVPVPTFIERSQIGIVDMAAIDRLDALTAPRLSEQYDFDPCPRPAIAGQAAAAIAPAARAQAPEAARRPAVTVEANYAVGEYDIAILSAAESKGLRDWLNGHGYRLPAGAEAVLGSYIGQGMRFLVAKVSLQRMPLLAGQFLRPLQVRYRARDIMLPIRLGMANASGPQELVIFTLSRFGRVEVANYPTVEMPSGRQVPLYVKEDFGGFYGAVFDRFAAQHMGAALVESALQLELSQDGTEVHRRYYGDGVSMVPQLIALGASWMGPGKNAPSNATPGEIFATRLHVRYDAAHFPEDLRFRETAKPDFETTYVVRHPWAGQSSCPAADAYRSALPARYVQEANDLVELTGWAAEDIRARMAASGEVVAK